MKHNYTFESIVIRRFQSVQFIMNVDSPFAIRTDTDFIASQRRTITSLHITEYRFGSSTVFPIPMCTKAGIYDGITPKVPNKKPFLAGMYTEIDQETVIGIESLIYTINFCRICL